MSGINEIKKKTKLSMDEMYDTQSVGKLDNQKDGKPEVKQVSQLDIKADFQPALNPVYQEKNQPINHRSGQTSIQQAEKPEIHPDIKQEPQISRSIFPATRQQAPKVPTYKMTFNLTEDIYKAFNDLYANRMLRGRKTEKSEMICEAIQWLIKMEEE